MPFTSELILPYLSFLSTVAIKWGPASASLKIRLSYICLIHINKYKLL